MKNAGKAKPGYENHRTKKGERTNGSYSCDVYENKNTKKKTCDNGKRFVCKLCPVMSIKKRAVFFSKDQPNKIDQLISQIKAVLWLLC